jgi:hypothetical protein
MDWWDAVIIQQENIIQELKIVPIPIYAKYIMIFYAFYTKIDLFNVLKVPKRFAE